jgi:hypothetical protein
MRRRTQQFIFQRVYDMASMVEAITSAFCGSYLAGDWGMPANDRSTMLAMAA